MKFDTVDLKTLLFLLMLNSWHFKFVIEIDLPDQGPDIMGGLPRYNIGDRVNVTCVSHNSMPAAQLQWYINGEKADPVHIKTYEPISMRGLLTSRLGLSFKVYHSK